MQLEDFVAETIRQIAAGVQRGQEDAKKEGTSVNPISSLLPGERVRMIEFDVAVTTEEGTSSKGGVGVLAGIVKLGAEGKSDSTTTSANRIKFSVPVLFPNSGPEVASLRSATAPRRST